MTTFVATTLAAIMSALAVVLTAQDRPLVFQVGSELVVLDVIATDADGREGSDLRRDEVQIEEDGAPRPIQHLQLVSRALRLRDPRHPPASAPATVTPVAPVPDRPARGL